DRPGVHLLDPAARPRGIAFLLRQLPHDRGGCGRSDPASGGDRRTAVGDVSSDFLEKDLVAAGRYCRFFKGHQSGHPFATCSVARELCPKIGLAKTRRWQRRGVAPPNVKIAASFAGEKRAQEPRARGCGDGTKPALIE